MKKWIISNLLLKILDLGITGLIIFKSDNSSETNPIVRHVIDNFGIFPGLLAIFIIFCLILCVAYRHKSVRSLKVVAAITMLVVINNFYWLYIAFVA